MLFIVFVCKGIGEFWSAKLKFGGVNHPHKYAQAPCAPKNGQLLSTFFFY